MSYPSDWSLFLRQMEQQPTPLDDEFGIFGSRYRVASEFGGLLLRGFAEETTEFYSAIAKIGLSFACLERLEKVLKDSSRSSILAPDLASELREVRFAGLFDLAIDHADSSLLQERLLALRTDEQINDVRPFIEAIRHSLFHGRFTPGTSKLRGSKRLMNLLDGLAQVTLRHADQCFSYALKVRI
jgi:hypothetical protein